MYKIRLIASALFLLAAVLTFSGLAVQLSPLFEFQAAPLFMRCAASGSAGACIMLGILLLLTLLTGRFYCSFLCPFGLLQDVFIFLSRRRSKGQKNFFLLRYLLLGIVAGLFFCGLNWGFLLLDPYSTAGRILSAFTVGGMTALILIALLAVWKQRIFCTALCPVGTFLGFLSCFSPRKLTISEACVLCGKCVKVCPSGCIDLSSRTLDNERCIRCMACVSGCPKKCIGFSASASIPGRRQFLISAGSFLTGLAAGILLARSGLIRLGEKMKILPPGAGNAGRFAQKCTACMLCAANCPSKIIVPARGGTGPVELDYSKGFCNHNCRRCSEVCPTGAIRPLSLSEKRKLKIAEAKFDPRNCIVFQAEEACGQCAGVCPTGAITLRKNGTPRPVKSQLCTGCGACQNICPAVPKAMKISPIEQQTGLEK